MTDRIGVGTRVPSYRAAAAAAGGWQMDFVPAKTKTKVGNGSILKRTENEISKKLNTQKQRNKKKM